jgi:hypothetical protein
MGAHLIEIVQRGDDGAPLRVPAADEVKQIVDRLRVYGSERFVEQDDGSILQEQAREQDALELSSRKRADAPIAKVLQAKHAERPLHGLAALAIEPAPGANVVPKPHGHGIEHGNRERPVDVDLLGEIGDVASLEPNKAEGTRKRLELPDDAPEQSGFAGAIRPDQREQIATGNLAGDVMHSRVPVVAEGQIMKVIAGCFSWVMRAPTATPRTTAGQQWPQRWRTAPALKDAGARSLVAARRPQARQRAHGQCCFSAPWTRIPPDDVAQGDGALTSP